MPDVFIHVRTDKILKEDAEKIISELGLTLSQAVRLLLHQIVIWRKFPLSLELPKESNKEQEKQENGKGILSTDEIRRVSPFILKILRAQGQKVL
ncbi:MAG: type II toxin-antitoxin system RelB/DinJ family antitoxin [Candidatus Riflebacteria bacterium]|nr:type II toxin-antitoxin system RelB/DinJ family antitoxin [Candidatus Riflebacteria bacterium]